MSTPVRTRLMPGVWLNAIQTRKFKSSYWSALLMPPLGEETAALNALLPRVLYQGTARYPSQQRLSEALEDLYGGVVSPVVAKLGEVQAVGFHGTFLDDAYAWEGESIAAKAAELMGDLLLRPATKNGRIRTDYLERERDNLIAEQRAQSNDKMRYAALRLNQEMCQGEAYAVDRLGSEETARRIRTPILHRHYQWVLSASPVELYYCGSTPVDRIAEYWREALMDLPRMGEFLLNETPLHPAPEQMRHVVQREDVTQAKLAIGLATATRLDDPLYPAMTVANALLGGAPTSMLFRHVREEQSLCYYAMSTLDPHKGLMGIHAGVAPQRVEQAKKGIFAQLEALQGGEYTQKELDGAKAHLCNQLRSSLDTHGGLYGFYTDQTQSRHPVTLEEQISLVEQVSRAEVEEAAARLQPDTVYLLTGEEAEHGEA